MVFSTINHHNHSNHPVVLAFYWVLCYAGVAAGEGLMVCGERGATTPGLGFDLLLSGLSFILICKLENSSPLYWVSPLESRREKLPPSRRLWEADLLWVLTGRGPGVWLMFVAPGRGCSPPAISTRSSPINTVRQLGLTTHPATGCVTAPNSGYVHSLTSLLLLSFLLHSAGLKYFSHSSPVKARKVFQPDIINNT